mmetsp:Transcript_10982/g.18296  ORF Transcript_10982/g.18296 Transcript_10982/m.18296 type:complete len:113 (-) Transcript_10982:159-497(-)
MDPPFHAGKYRARLSPGGGELHQQLGDFGQGASPVYDPALFEGRGETLRFVGCVPTWGDTSAYLLSSRFSKAELERGVSREAAAVACVRNALRFSDALLPRTASPPPRGLVL